MLGVLPAHLPLVFGAGTVLESVPLLSFFSLLCDVTVQGGGRCETIHMVIIAVHSAYCTAATMDLTSIKQRVLVTTLESHVSKLQCTVFVFQRLFLLTTSILSDSWLNKR